MKNFLKLFLIVVSFFITLSANAQSVSTDMLVNLNNNQVIVDKITLPDFELSIEQEHNENVIVASNNRNYELSACHERRNSHVSGCLDRVVNKNKLLQQIFNNQYNKCFCSASHKISSYLKNEICTRAP